MKCMFKTKARTYVRKVSKAVLNVGGHVERAFYFSVHSSQDGCENCTISSSVRLLANPNRAHGHLLHSFQGSYEYLIDYQSEDSSLLINDHVVASLIVLTIDLGTVNKYVLSM